MQGPIEALFPLVTGLREARGSPAGAPWQQLQNPHQPRVNLTARRGQVRSGTSQGRAWRRRPPGKRGEKIPKERKKRKERGEKKSRVSKTKRWCPQAGAWRGSRKMAPASLCPRGHPPRRPPDTLPSKACLSGRRPKTSKGASPSTHRAESPPGRLALGLEAGESGGPRRALPQSADGSWGLMEGSPGGLQS